MLPTWKNSERHVQELTWFLRVVLTLVLTSDKRGVLSYSLTYFDHCSVRTDERRRGTLIKSVIAVLRPCSTVPAESRNNVGSFSVTKPPIRVTSVSQGEMKENYYYEAGGKLHFSIQLLPCNTHNQKVSIASSSSILTHVISTFLSSCRHS